jgi:hypothetical protein
MDWLKRMNRAMDYIEMNLTGEIELTKVARKACCSSHQFQRMFSFITNVTLSEYIRRRREGKPIFFAGMYLIYREEVQLYNQIGLKEFWFTEGFELYNPRRKKLTSNIQIRNESDNKQD